MNDEELYEGGDNASHEMADKLKARITELENALNAMLKIFEYDGQGEDENVACWDARVALKVHGYNKTIKEIAKGEK